MKRPTPQAMHKTASSGIRDNHSRGKAGEFVAELLSSDTELSIVSAYFTIHAYGALRDKLEKITSC